MKYALVLGGGGGKGAYEVGVWKALIETGLAKFFSLTVGTSVGALNAAFFAQGKLDEAYTVWKTIDADIILSKNRNFSLRDALYNQEGLRELIEKHLGEFSEEINAYVCCSRVLSSSTDITFLDTDREETYEAVFAHLNKLKRSECVSYMLASSSIPFIYGKVEINGKFYRDGGILPAYNIPWRKAVELGAQRVFAVSLDDGNPISYERKGDAKVLILRPSVNLGNLLDGTLDFHSESAKRRMKLGYDDAMHYWNTIQRFLEQ